jgi:hypothetical protein
MENKLAPIMEITDAAVEIIKKEFVDWTWVDEHPDHLERMSKSERLVREISIEAASVVIDQLKEHLHERVPFIKNIAAEDPKIYLPLFGEVSQEYDPREVEDALISIDLRALLKNEMEVSGSVDDLLKFASFLRSIADEFEKASKE